MNIGERIKKLRKELDLTQQKFGERIGIKGNTVAQYELGRNEPGDAVFSLICREFSVNEEWLRTGEGEIFKPEPSDLLDQLAHKHNLSNAAYIMIEKFLKLRPEIQNAIYDYLHEVDAALQEDGTNPYAPAYAETDPPQQMDRIMETIKNQQKENADQKISVEQAEAEYIKSRSVSVRNMGSSALNITDDTEKASNG